MVLVTGGTGLVGSHLLLHLVEQGVPVRAIYRSGSHLEQVEKIFSYYSPFAGAFFKKIEWVMADLLDLPSMENAFVGIEKVQCGEPVYCTQGCKNLLCKQHCDHRQ